MLPCKSYLSRTLTAHKPGLMVYLVSQWSVSSNRASLIFSSSFVPHTS